LNSLILIAHRGGLYYRPENSLAAFEHSVALGVEWAECDIRLSRDLVPVLSHDDRIDLPSGGDKGIRELDLRELRKLDIGGGERVPSLKEVLEKFGNNLRFDIELKELDAVEKVIRLIFELKLSERVVISSFIPEALQLARDIAPQIPRGLLVDRLMGRIIGSKSAVKAGVMFQCEYFLPHYANLTSEWISAARNEGMKVIPWTVNQLDDGRRLADLGVDGLVTDRVDQFFSLLRNYK
jgi:glycerophosphoryl diester phosphodiesterase